MSRPSTSSASSCSRCLTMTASGWCSASSRAWSSKGLYATTRVGSMPHDADTMTFGLRVVDPDRELGCREAAEHHGVDRARAGRTASIAMTASGIIGM